MKVMIMFETDRAGVKRVVHGSLHLDATRIHTYYADDVEEGYCEITVKDPVLRLNSMGELPKKKCSICGTTHSWCSSYCETKPDSECPAEDE